VTKIDELNLVLNEQYGFKQTPRTIGDVFFSGTLMINGFNVVIELQYLSELLLEPPSIFLKDWSFDQDLRTKVGTRHIDSHGKVCYYDISRDLWDCTQATRLTVGIIEKVTSILVGNINRISDPDWVRDFNGYWKGNDVLLSVKPTNKMRMSYWECGNKRWLVDPKSPPSWLDVSKEINIQWCTVKLPCHPTPVTEDWLPQTLLKTIRWMKGFISRPEQLISKALCEQYSSYKNAINHEIKAILFYWEEKSGEQYFAFSFKLNDAQNKALEQKRQKGLATLLMDRYIPIEIKRFSPVRADPKYIHCRSLPEGTGTLKGLNIVQIGAGAIGGYLAQQVASLGGGWGNKGSYTIIDNDILSPANVGRHLLGMNAVGENKSEALAKQLKLAFPHLNIIASTSSITNDHSSLNSHPDIVLNATGSETVGIAIEYILRQKYDERPPVIHGWILGHGLAAQSFIRKDEKGACFQCLSVGEGTNRIRRHELSKAPIENLPVFAPCHQSFYPFIVTVATSAANLMSIMMMEWLQKKNSDTLQHVIFQPEKCFNRKNTTPDKNKLCSVCGVK